MIYIHIYSGEMTKDEGACAQVLAHGHRGKDFQIFRWKIINLEEEAWWLAGVANFRPRAEIT